jgi:glycosyltransferase involved in cell wall biosynthesis
MRVIQLTNYDSGDGPSNAAQRLHAGLTRLGHDALMFVSEVRTDDDKVKRYVPPGDLMSRVKRRVRSGLITASLARYRASRPRGLELFSDDRTAHGNTLLPQLPHADIINVHAIRLFADHTAFFTSVPRHTPVVRTLHDMNFLTGGCHSNEGCERYTQHCGTCPQLGSHRANDLSHQVWARKRQTLQRVQPDRLHIVTASQWMAEAAKRSSLLQSFPITVIPFGLDTDEFCPIDRRAARESLRIDDDVSVLLFVAEPLIRRIKGFSLLAQALEGLPHPDRLLLITMGSGKPPARVGVPHLGLGHVRSDRLRALAYSAADVVVMPSLQENFPLTAMEALSCGTPVVGFATGGLPELVRPGTTGLLAPLNDVAALRDRMATLLGDASMRATLSANCRRIAVNEYRLELYTRRYLDLYEHILSLGPTPIQGT